MRFNDRQQQNILLREGRPQTSPYRSFVSKNVFVGRLFCACKSSLIGNLALFLALFVLANFATFLPQQSSKTQAHTEAASLETILRDARQARLQFDYAKALRLLEKAAKNRQASAELLNEYGMIYLDAEDVQRAATYFDEALKLNANFEAAIAGRAEVDLMNRADKLAENRLRQYLARKPRSSRAQAMLARVYFENNRIEEAQAAAEQALAIDANDKDALHVSVLVKVIQKEPNAARALAERALALDANDVNMRRVLAQFVDGRAGYLQWIPDTARTSYEQGRVFKEAGKFAEAETAFEKALSAQPRYYRALIALGDIWLRSEDYERAATAARLALAIDANGANAHLELSYANAGIQERARIEIGASDFAAAFFKKPKPQTFALTAEIFPNYKALSKKQQMVIDWAVEPLAFFLPELARKGARHYLIAFDERAADIQAIANIASERTADGRFYASIRGVGGRTTVSGLEYIGLASRAGFNTIAHEFAHQVHLTAMDKGSAKTIRKLYDNAMREGRALDYYAETDEYEYFAQGYEAFIADVKRPAAGATSRHTRRELQMRDPELYRFLESLAKKSL